MPALIAATALAGPSASASGFDPTEGKVLLHDAAFGVGFEALDQLPSGVGFTALSAFGTPLADYARAELFVSDPDGAIEGDGYLEVGGRTGIAYLDLRTTAAASLVGRRIEVKIWQRVQGTRAQIGLVWMAAGTDQVLAGGFDVGTEIGAVVFQPTGRSTQDGWEEWTSGPIDAGMAGLAPALLRVYDEQIFGLQSGRIDYDGTLRVQLDGLEVVDLGEAAVPDVACRLLEEDTACGPVGACLYGRCVDATPVLGAQIQDPTLRAQYIERRIFELRYFEGGRFPLTQIDLFEPELRSQASEDATARSFRTALNVAYQRLADGHAAPPFTSLRVQAPNAGVCLHTGEADLMPSPTSMPMVFNTQDGTPFANQLQTGDVLFAVDDVSFRDWAPLARRYSHYSGDPSAREVVSTPELFAAALLSGSKLSFARCTRPSGCNTATLERIDIETASLTEGVFTGNPPAWLQTMSVCDFRLHSAVPGSGDHEYAYAASRTEGGVQYLQINGMPDYFQPGGEAWFSTVTAALRGGPERVLFDQRLGMGGSVRTVDHIGAHLVSTFDLYAMHLLPQVDREMTDDLRSKLLECSGTTDFTTSCGDFLEWQLGTYSYSGPTATRSRVAVLNGGDVSGNDFVTRMLTMRTAGDTRIFGPARTYGAFGVVWTRPAFFGEIAGGSFQVHDAVFLEDRSDRNLNFTTGRGVEPDVEVLQRQSDAIRGVDTVLEEAKAWVQQ